MPCPGCEHLGIRNTVDFKSDLQGLPPRVLSLAVSGEYTNKHELADAVRAFPAVRPQLAALVAQRCSLCWEPVRR